MRRLRGSRRLGPPRRAVLSSQQQSDLPPQSITGIDTAARPRRGRDVFCPASISGSSSRARVGYTGRDGSRFSPRSTTPPRRLTRSRAGIDSGVQRVPRRGLAGPARGWAGVLALVASGCPCTTAGGRRSGWGVWRSHTRCKPWTGALRRARFRRSLGARDATRAMVWRASEHLRGGGRPLPSSLAFIASYLQADRGARRAGLVRHRRGRGGLSTAVRRGSDRDRSAIAVSRSACVAVCACPVGPGTSGAPRGDWDPSLGSRPCGHGEAVSSARSGLRALQRAFPLLCRGRHRGWTRGRALGRPSIAVGQRGGPGHAVWALLLTTCLALAGPPAERLVFGGRCRFYACGPLRGPLRASRRSEGQALMQRCCVGCAS